MHCLLNRRVLCPCAFQAVLECVPLARHDFMMNHNFRSTHIHSVFTVCCREYVPACAVYLQAVLREPILAVLADDDLDLEIDPVIVWSRLSDAQKTEIFGADHATQSLTTDMFLRDRKFRVSEELIASKCPPPRPSSA